MKRSRDGSEISVTKETGETNEEDARVDAISTLHDDELSKIFEILGQGYFRPVAETCKRFYRVYTHVHPDCETSAEILVQSVPGAAFFRREANQGSPFRLSVAWPSLSEMTDSHAQAWFVTPCGFIHDVAALHGRLDVLQQSTRRFLNYGFGEEYAASLAALGGHLDVLKFLRELGYKCGRDDCCYAAAKGHLEVVQWIVSGGFRWQPRICDYAARFGHLHVLQWARANDYRIERSVIYQATRNGHNDVAEWARANGI